ncbi:uncharacterized protein LOC131996396 [Stomoxys calcitrans]|uniref:uncharacterized protein LOC131996396 n=1 Tax=Stomoxys calcitrans TaxID=35570 RepID=UPI0027E2773E|nr:uncharacterized protein LOC131996396 [Stomoxys calcitrans]
MSISLQYLRNDVWLNMRRSAIAASGRLDGCILKRISKCLLIAENPFYSNVTNVMYRQTVNPDVQHLMNDSFEDEEDFYKFTKNNKKKFLFAYFNAKMFLVILQHLAMWICHFLWIFNTKLSYLALRKPDIHTASCLCMHWMAKTKCRDMTYYIKSLIFGVRILSLNIVYIILSLYELVFSFLLVFNRFMYVCLCSGLQ